MEELVLRSMMKRDIRKEMKRIGVRIRRVRRVSDSDSGCCWEEAEVDGKGIDSKENVRWNGLPFFSDFSAVEVVEEEAMLRLKFFLTNPLLPQDPGQEQSRFAGKRFEQ